MVWRSWVIRAVPAAAISSAPAMAASKSATASDRCRCAPRKLMLTAFAFWMMKISTTTRMTVPAISAMRMLLIRVRDGPGIGGCGAGRAEPLADGGGRVLVAPDGSAAGSAAGSVMTGLPLQRRTRVAGDLAWPPLVTPDGWPPSAADPATCAQPILETGN